MDGDVRLQDILVVEESDLISMLDCHVYCQAA